MAINGDDALTAFASRASMAPWSEEDRPSSFTDTVSSAFSLTRREELFDSAGRAWMEQTTQRADTIGKLGGDRSKAWHYSGISPNVARELRRAEIDGNLESNPYWRALQSTPQVAEAYRYVREFERRYPTEVLDDAMLALQWQTKAAQQRDKEQPTIERGSGFGAFVGSAGAVMTDPLVLLTLPLGAEVAPGRSILSTMLRTGAVEGGIGAATEIPIQLQVARFKEDIESPWSFKDSAINVLSAGAGGAVIGGVTGGGVEAISRSLDKRRELKAARQIQDTPETAAAERVLEDTLQFHQENPLDPSMPSMSEAAHERAFETARAQDELGQAIDVRDQVAGVEMLDPIDRTTQRISDPAQLIDIDPTTVKTDAAVFQYKSGADQQGVTNALGDVVKFDRRLAGVALIWERADGERFIADGHQRLGLASKALAAGQDPAEVRLNGFVLRESDGITASDARQMAAIKNMAEGTGTSLDAAKILRQVGPLGETALPPLPPRSALVRNARGLARLDDEQFMQVVNGVIDERFGAMIGAATDDGALQQAMVQIIKRTQPANEVQARSIIDQVKLQGVEVRTTADLFGERQVAESLYLERAQVLDAALRRTKTEKAVFGQLIAKEDHIAGAGNKLNRAANLSKVQEALDAATYISALANARGPLSDALSAAARSVSEGKSLADAAASFFTAVRQQIGKEPIRRPKPGPAQRASDGAGTAKPVDHDKFIKDFVDSQPVDAYEHNRQLQELVQEIESDWSSGKADEYSRNFGPDQINAELHEEDAARFYDDDDDLTDLGNRRYSEVETALSTSIAIKYLGEPKKRVVDFSRPEDAAEVIHQYAEKVGLNPNAVGGSGKSASKYFSVDDGSGGRLDLRISDHELPDHYVNSSNLELVIPQGDDAESAIKRFMAQLDKLARENTNATSSSRELGSQAPGEAGMMERKAVRAAKTGSPTEPSQLKNEVGGASSTTKPRPIVKQVDNPRSAEPTATRTGTVSDDDYSSVLSQFESLAEDRQGLLEVTSEIDGELVKRSAQAQMADLDRLEDTLERVRVCATPERATA